ncbi:MAG: BsuBI/PstI family type II restriction endonuclease [Acutalibacteraceae bacterium]
MLLRFLISIFKIFRNARWEPEVWIADMPDHMIHLNGSSF